MNTQQSDDLNRVLEKICEVAEKSAGGDYVYRGEPACYSKVSSTLYREYEEEIEAENFEIDVVQEEILDEARKYTRETAHDLEILTELQHHGGKTNLIDFTTDYLIALFFACDGEHDKAGRVILLEKESDDYKVEKPPKTINRVESQKSIFVQASGGFVEPDKVVTVPKGLNQAMLNYLRKHHDISTETIYNDLHGFITKRSIHESAYTQFYKGMTCQNRGNSAKTRTEKQEWYDKSVEHYTDALDLKPDLPVAYNNRGNAYFRKGEVDNAIKDLTTAIELNPVYATAYYNRGTAYKEKGELDNAIKDLTTAIELNHDFADAYTNRGTAYFQKGELDNTIKDFTTAIELKPDDADAYTNRGAAYFQKGERDNALNDFTTAIERNPDFAEAYYNRGEAWMHLSEWDKAKADLTVARDMGADILIGFQNDYENVADFEKKNGVTVPADIKEMLTQR